MDGGEVDANARHRSEHQIYDIDVYMIMIRTKLKMMPTCRQMAKALSRVR